MPDADKHVSVLIPRLPLERFRLDACDQPAVVFFNNPQLIGLRDGDAVIAKRWENSDGVCPGGSAVVLNANGGVAAACLSNDGQLYLPLHGATLGFERYRFECDVRAYPLPWEAADVMQSRATDVRRRIGELDSLRDERDLLSKRVERMEASRLWRLTRALARIFGR